MWHFWHEQASALIDIVLWPIFHFTKWRPSAIFDFYKLEISTSGLVWRPCVPNFVKICQTVLEIWPIFDFSRCRPSAILDFQTLEISTSGPVRRPNMRHRTKFREDRSNRSRDIADFRFFKISAVRHLGLVLRGLGPRTKSTWWCLWLCKIWL